MQLLTRIRTVADCSQQLARRVWGFGGGGAARRTLDDAQSRAVAGVALLLLADLLVQALADALGNLVAIDLCGDHGDGAGGKMAGAGEERRRGWGAQRQRFEGGARARKSENIRRGPHMQNSGWQHSCSAEGEFGDRHDDWLPDGGIFRLTMYSQRVLND